MKNLINTTANRSETFNNILNNLYGTKQLHESNGYAESYSSKSTGNYKERLLTPAAVYQMSAGRIPDLQDVCQDLSDTFNYHRPPYSAAQFIPVLQNIDTLDPDQLNRFLKNRDTRHVLISNDLFEVVLIHWKPGKVSDIHGHPGGGCIFKLMHGRLEELRFSPVKSPRLLSMNGLRKGNMAYIDDSIAYHQVGNPYGSSAVSLHVYLK